MARNKYDTTEPRQQNPLSNSARSYISNNKILKFLRKAKHPIEFIPSYLWAEWRKKRQESGANNG